MASVTKTGAGLASNFGNSPIVLGLEFGGTKLQAALGDGAGTLWHQKRTSAAAAGGRQALCQQMEDLIAQLLDAARLTPADLAAAGIGFGGPVDSARGIVCKSHQVAGWDDFPLRDWLAERLPVPTVLANDSDCAGLAEALFGAGRHHSPVFYMNIGSGIGGALVVHGRLYSGQGLGAAEIGHVRILPGEPGQPWRTLESLCSGWSLAAAAEKAAQANPSSRLHHLRHDAHPLTGEQLVEAVRQNDPTARQVWDEAVDILGVALANVIALLHPACLVIGGGIGLAGETLLTPLRTAVARQVFSPFAGRYQIVAAALGETVVLHGALKLARDAVETCR